MFAGFTDSTTDVFGCRAAAALLMNRPLIALRFLCDLLLNASPPCSSSKPSEPKRLSVSSREFVDACARVSSCRATDDNDATLHLLVGRRSRGGPAPFFVDLISVSPWSKQSLLPRLIWIVEVSN